MNNKYPKLTGAYCRLFKELSNKNRYVVRTVYDHYVLQHGKADPNKVTVVLRIDVDWGLHLSEPLAFWINHYGLTATHYFLTHSKRYYNVWKSGKILRQIASWGQEVGLHTDHLYKELTYGTKGLDSLKKDIKRLSQVLGEHLKGMVYHGHQKIDAMGRTNWELTKDINSSDLGLEYHDGLKSVYIEPGETRWQPKCHAKISDYMGFSESWGWNYLPFYPSTMLKLKGRKGEVFHIAFHTHSAFKYWNHWTNCFDEIMPKKDSNIVFWKKRVLIFYRFFILPLYRAPLVRILECLKIKHKVKALFKSN